MPYAYVVSSFHGIPHVYALPHFQAYAPPPPFFLSSTQAHLPVQPIYGTAHAQMQPPYPAHPLTYPTAAAAASAAAAAAAAAAASARPGDAGDGQAAANAAAQPAAAAAAAAAADGGEGMDDGEDGRADGIRLLLKLVFFVYILGQDGTQQRLFLLTLGAVIIFLAQTGRLDFMQRLMIAVPTFTVPPPPPPPPPPPVPAEGGEEREGGAAAGEAGAGAETTPPAPPPEPEGAVMSFVRDVESVVGAFFASLLPSWRPDGANAGDEPPAPQQQMAAGPGANF